jgi:hypothetical protein
MARILTVDPEQARGLRKLIVRLIRRQTGGMFPGIFQIIMRDFQSLSLQRGSTAISMSVKVRP